MSSDGLAERGGCAGGGAVRRGPSVAPNPGLRGDMPAGKDDGL